MDQGPIWNRAAVEADHIYFEFAQGIAMIGALVHKQNQNLLRLKQAIKVSELLLKQSVLLRSRKWYIAKPTSNPRRANASMRRTPLYQLTRQR